MCVCLYTYSNESELLIDYHLKEFPLTNKWFILLSIISAGLSIAARTQEGAGRRYTVSFLLFFRLDLEPH